MSTRLRSIRSLLGDGRLVIETIRFHQNPAVCNSTKATAWLNWLLIFICYFGRLFSPSFRLCLSFTDPLHYLCTQFFELIIACARYCYIYIHICINNIFIYIFRYFIFFSSVFDSSVFCRFRFIFCSFFRFDCWTVALSFCVRLLSLSFRRFFLLNYWRNYLMYQILLYYFLKYCSVLLVSSQS